MNWQYDSTLEIRVTKSLKYQVKIQIVETSSGEVRSSFLKFNEAPSSESIEAEAANFCAALNTPPEAEEEL